MAANRLSLAVSEVDWVGGGRGGSHLVSNSSAPLYHFRYSVFVLVPARLPDGIDDGEITLQCVESSNGILSCR